MSKKLGFQDRRLALVKLYSQMGCSQEFCMAEINITPATWKRFYKAHYNDYYCDFIIQAGEVIERLLNEGDVKIATMIYKQSEQRMRALEKDILKNKKPDVDTGVERPMQILTADDLPFPGEYAGESERLKAKFRN